MDAALVVAVRRKGLTPHDHAFLDGVSTGLVSRAASSYVRSVYSAAVRPELAPLLRSPDGQAEIVVVDLRPASADGRVTDGVAFLRHRLAASPPGLRTSISGLAGLNADQAAALRTPPPWPVLAGLLLLFGVLVLLVRRSAAAALVALLTVAAAFLLARGTIVLFLPARAGAANLAGLFMAAAILVLTMDHVGVVISPGRPRSERDPAGIALLATAVIPGALLVAFTHARLEIYRWIALDVAVALAVTAVAVLTLAPALAAMVRRRFPAAFGRSANPRLAGRGLGRARQHPVALPAAGALVIVVASATLAGFRSSADPAAGLPAASEARHGFDALARHYPSGLLAPAYVLVSAGGAVTNDGALAAIDRLTDELRSDRRLSEVRSLTQPAGAPLTLANLPRLVGGPADPRALGIDPDRVDITPLYERLARPGGLRLDAEVLGVYPQVRDRLGFFLSADARTTRLVVIPGQGPDAPETRAALGALQHRAASSLRGSPLSGAVVEVGGPGMASTDLDAAGRGDARAIVILTSLAVVVALVLLTRSLGVALAVALATAAAFAAATGLTVVVFQHVLASPPCPSGCLSW